MEVTWPLSLAHAGFADLFVCWLVGLFVCLFVRWPREVSRRLSACCVQE